jgi:hypothetical protein
MTKSVDLPAVVFYWRSTLVSRTVWKLFRLFVERILADHQNRPLGGLLDLNYCLRSIPRPPIRTSGKLKLSYNYYLKKLIQIFYFDWKIDIQQVELGVLETSDSVI